MIINKAYDPTIHKKKYKTCKKFLSKSQSEEIIKTRYDLFKITPSVFAKDERKDAKKEKKKIAETYNVFEN